MSKEMNKIRELHLALSCCQPNDPISHFFACDCGQLLFWNNRDKEFTKCYEVLECEIELVESMIHENPTVFARIAKVHKFRRMPKLPLWCYLEEEESNV